MPKSKKSPSKSDAPAKAAQKLEKSAPEDIKPPESAENFEHVIRRIAIERERLRQSV